MDLRKHHTNKASGGDGIPVELSQILKDDAVKVLQSISQQIGNISSGHGTESGFNSILTVNFQMFKLDLGKAEESEIKLPKFVGSLKKQESSKIIIIIIIIKIKSTSALLTTPKSLTVWITTNCGKFLKRWEFQTT